MPLKVIYADILLTINLTVDYLVLFGTARLAGIRFSRIKGLFAAMTGAVYSLIVLFNFSGGVLSVTELAVSTLMLIIAFGKRKAGEFFRLLLIFYICGMLFSGFMMLINSVIHAENFFIKSGIVYFEFSAIGIVASGTAAFAITEILRRIFRRGEPDGKFIARIFYSGEHAVLKGFTDTGNFLSDPFTGTPVAVVSAESTERILPEEMLSAIRKNTLSTDFGLRYIPCKTVSGSVLIPAFRPEKVIIENENGTFEPEDILIGISKNVPENTMIIGKNLVLKEKHSVFSEVQ